MKIFGSILFAGDALQAAEYYTKILDANLRVVKFGDMPNLPPHLSQYKDMVARATITGDDFVLALSDSSDLIGKGSVLTSRMRVTMLLDTTTQAQELYNVLAQDAKGINMPFMSTPFAKGFGLIVDKYNVEWEICGEVL
jgi:PhnB protein